MDENIKKTPARRRRGGGQRPSGRKNYASEGDILSEMPVPSGYPTAYPANFPAGLPATPSKSNTGSPAPGSQQANPKSTSRKNGKKGRPESLSATPGPPRTGRGTPPQSASVFESAFATSRHFHASPAPSTLPMPKFKLKRSESTGVRPTQEQSPPASDCETPSPSQPATLARSQPPDALNFLFNAHRAEQQKKQQQDKEDQTWRSQSAHATVSHEQGPFTAPPGLQASQSMNGFNDQPVPFKLAVRPAQQRAISEHHEHSVSGPRPEIFSMPLHERIRAERAAGAHSQLAQQRFPSHQQQKQQPHPQQQLATPPLLDDRSEQVKRLLGIGSATPSPRPAPQPPMHYHGSPSVSLSPSAQFHNGHQNTVNYNRSTAPNHADDLKKRGEDAIRQVLGLSNFLPISTGLDGNSSPQPQAGASSKLA